MTLGLLVSSCQNNSTTLKIKGAADLDDNSTIYHIVADLNNQPTTLDTLTVNKGVFNLVTEIAEPNIHFLQIAGQQGSFPFIAESGTVTIELYKDSLGLSKATGTQSNDDFMRYKSETKVYIESLNAIGNDLQQAMILKDSLMADDLQQQYQDVRDQIQQYEIDFIKSSSNSLISILILERLVANKVIPINEANDMFELLSDRIKNTRSGRAIQKQFDEPPKAEVGQVAPTFEGPSPEGAQFALENGLGKVTIIDFWASWCGPCQNMAPIYERVAQASENLLFAKLNTEQAQKIAAEANIRSIPTIIFFHQGKEIDRISGGLNEAQLKQWLLINIKKIA